MNTIPDIDWFLLAERLFNVAMKLTNYWFIFPISQPVTEMDYKCLAARSLKEKEVQRSNLGVNQKQLLEHQTFTHSATKFNNSKTLTFYIYGSKMFATWCLFLLMLYVPQTSI